MTGNALHESRRRLHARQAVLSALKNSAVFLLAPVIAIHLLTLYTASSGIAVASSVTDVARTITYLGIGITAAAVASAFLGNERLSGLVLRIVSQGLTAVYALYVIGRGYSFIIAGKVSMTLDIYPVALSIAVIALLRILPPLLEYLEKMGRRHQKKAMD